MSLLSRGISKNSLPDLVSQCSGRKPGMWRMSEVFASMVGLAPPEDGESAKSMPGEQRISETTIMARNVTARRIFSSMGETSVHRKLKKPVTVHAAKPANNFNAAYFRKFYLNASTRVVTAAEMRSRAALISGALRQCQIPIRSILDAGCGMGLLRKPFKQLLPRARYMGLEAREYLFGRFGWASGSLTDFAPRKPFDLVVCYDALQYLPDEHAARAIRNFSALTRAALYVSALTTEDWRENCDRSRTDRAVHLRSAAWYR